jgi:hypothetical protein
MSFDDSWYGMRRHSGERGVFIPGEGFRAAPLPPWVPPAPAQPLAPPVPTGSPEAAGESQTAENGLPDASVDHGISNRSSTRLSRNVLREIGAEIVPSRLLLNKIARVSEADRAALVH